MPCCPADPALLSLDMHIALLTSSYRSRDPLKHANAACRCSLTAAPRHAAPSSAPPVLQRCAVAPGQTATAHLPFTRARCSSTYQAIDVPRPAVPRHCCAFGRRSATAHEWRPPDVSPRVRAREHSPPWSRRSVIPSALLLRLCCAPHMLTVATSPVAAVASARPSPHRTPTVRPLRPARHEQGLAGGVPCRRCRTNTLPTPLRCYHCPPSQSHRSQCTAATVHAGRLPGVGSSLAVASLWSHGFPCPSLASSCRRCAFPDWD